jgi:hypothetical protein
MKELQLFHATPIGFKGKPRLGMKQGKKFRDSGWRLVGLTLRGSDSGD